jgi:hypothetical protein
MAQGEEPQGLGRRRTRNEREHNTNSPKSNIRERKRIEIERREWANR